MRWLDRSLVLPGVAAVSSCMTYVWTWADGWSNPAAVPLTSGLPREFVAKSPAFDATVKARFPIGTPVAAMGLELQQEGFARQDWSDLPGQEHHARRYDGGAPFCNQVAWVYWKADEDDRLTAVRGDYHVGCL